MARVGLSPSQLVQIDAARATGLKLLESAMAQAEVTPQQMAIDCGQDLAEFSRALHGKARFDLAWLFCQSLEFREAFWHAVARAWGVRTDRRRRAAMRKVIDAIQQLVLSLDE